MSSFDPATVRQAVAEFTPLRPQKFQDLIPAKEVIIELRQRLIFAGLHPAFACEIGVKFHLVDVGVDEFADFKVNDPQPD